MTQPTLTRPLLLALALVATALGCGKDHPVVDLDATASAPGTLQLPRDLPVAAAPAEPAAATDKSQPAARDDAEAQGLVWRAIPASLRIWRDTEVSLKVQGLPVGRNADSVRCRWSIKGAAEDLIGCSVKHTFVRSAADAEVKLTVTDGDWSLSSTRPLPLDSLSVTVDAPEPTADVGLAIPNARKPTATSFRLLLLADSDGDPAQAQRATQTLLERTQPTLGIHVGGLVAAGGGDKAWDGSREAIARSFEAAKVPIVYAMSPTDLQEGARVRRPDITMLDARDYPARYSFSFKNSFFAVISSKPDGGLSEDELTWLTDSLAKAHAFDGRFVVSYHPLSRFTDAGRAVLQPKFRVYELLLRAQATAFISAGERAYFHGRYGALSAISVGPISGEGVRLLGGEFAQPASATVVDVAAGVPRRVFAVVGPDFSQRLDEVNLPEAVEVYTK